MSGFDDRQKAHENKFALDGELMFKARARAAKLLGKWVAEQVGLPADVYATELVNLVTDGKSDQEVIEKVAHDAVAKGTKLAKELVGEKLQQCLIQAREQIANS